MKSETLQDCGADLAQFIRRHPWLTTSVALVALGWLVYFGLEWHSEMSWQRYAAAARAQGVKMQLADFIRPEIPDEQNFAALPMFQKANLGNGEDTPFKLPYRSSPRAGQGGNTYSPPNFTNPPTFGDPMKGQKIDWLEWQKYFKDVGYLSETSDNPTADVLRALERYAPLFQQWSEWHRRPQCRFTLDYSQGVMLAEPHLSIFQNAARIFSLRMRAHLAGGDSAAAYADFRDGLQAYHALREEPMLIDGLVRIALLYVLLGGVGDGLQDHAWSDAECEKIERDLAAIRVWEDWRLALSTERGAFNTTMDSWANLPLRKRDEQIASYAISSKVRWIFNLFPRVMIRDSQLRQNRFIDELLAGFDAANQTFDLDHPTPSAPQNITGTLDGYRYFLCQLVCASFGQIESRYAQVQTKLDQARVACALERSRFAHGAYPETLAALVPDYLPAVPPDIYAHAPYRYQRVNASSFRLYSVGANRQDDGGQIVPGVSARHQLDDVWPYAPAAPAPTAP